jgi:hypothetical protein
MRPDTEPGEPELLLIRCERVDATGYGFVRIIPHRDRKQPTGEEMDWFALPPTLLAWVAETPVGFSFG